MTVNLKTFFYFGIAGLALIALADFMPKAAIMFAVILLMGVVLTNYQSYASLLIPPKK